MVWFFDCPVWNHELDSVILVSTFDLCIYYDSMTMNLVLQGHNTEPNMWSPGNILCFCIDFSVPCHFSLNSWYFSLRNYRNLLIFRLFVVQTMYTRQNPAQYNYYVTFIHPYCKYGKYFWILYLMILKILLLLPKSMFAVFAVCYWNTTSIQIVFCRN